MNTFDSIADYRSVQHHALVEENSPHRFIQMLLAGALERIAQAKGAIAQGMYEIKGERVNKAIDIISALRGCLDDSEGGELAENLDALYDYMIRRLFEANVSLDVKILDEVTVLLSSIKQSWDAIERQVTRINTGTNITDIGSELNRKITKGSALC